MFYKFTKKISRLLCAGLILAAQQLPALAQTPSPIPSGSATLARYLDPINGMTAAEAVAFALENNGELAAARKETEAARALVKQARLRPNPSVGFSRQEQIGGKDNDTMIAGSLPLELGGRRKTRINVAIAELTIREKEVANRERLLATEVRTKFGEALAQTLKLKLVEDLLETAFSGYRLVQARVTEGKTAPLEENMTLVEVNRLRSTREIEAGKTEIAFLELRNLLGMKPEEPLRLRGDFKDLLAPLPPLAEAAQQALQTRPDLQAMRAIETLAEANIEQAHAGGRIDASVSAGYGRNNFSFPVNGITNTGQLRPVQDVFHSFKFGVTLELPVRNRNQGAIEAAVVNLDAATKRREFAELTVRREVAAAFTRYQSAARAMEIFRVGVRDQAKTNLGVVRQTYELGRRNLIEYLVEERRFIELENEFIDAQLMVYLAQAEILRATNAPELIKK
ncbi:MAG TPA: TolC family protein [Pyrinomonadaceae bacterium]|nr:TolC family protein [Pyrinomonadaceae bacterium]